MTDLSTLSDADLAALHAQVAPDLSGMSDADLQAMHGSMHPVAGPSGNFLTDVGRRLGTAGATAAGALLSTPRSLAQGVDWLAGKAGYNPGADAALAGIKDPTDANKPAFPDFQTARDMAFNTTGGTEYQPQTWLGRRTQDALTGLAMGATGNFRAIPAAMGFSATGGAAAEAFPDHPLAAALLGGIPGHMAANAAVSAPQRLVSALASKPNVEPYAAFNRLGLPTQLSGTTTGEPGLVYAEKLAARMPGSEGAVSNARNKLTAAWQDKLNSVADSLGAATTPTEVGTSLQGAANNWLSNFKTNTGNLWNDYYSKVPQTTPYAVNNYEGALQKTLGNFPGAPATGGVLQPATLKGLSDALGVDLKAGGGTLPAETVHAMRTAIGEKLANPQTIADTSQAALKQLYSGLSEDIKAGAGGVSPEALTAFHKANAATAAGHDLLETHLDPILRAASPEQAAQYALSQARLGGSRLGALTLNLPGAAGDLGSYALRNTATNIESPTAMANAMLGRKPMLSQEAQRVLFPNAGTQQDIADLAATGKAMQPLEKDLNNSPTATHSARGPGRLIAAAELARQGHELAGMPGAVGGGLVGMFAPNVAGKIAQATALNPYLSALYGRNIPIQPATPSRLARVLIAPALGAPGQQVVLPATSASSLPRSP